MQIPCYNDECHAPRDLQIIGLLMRHTVCESCRKAELHYSVIWHLTELICFSFIYLNFEAQQQQQQQQQQPLFTLFR